MGLDHSQTGSGKPTLKKEGMRIYQRKGGKETKVEHLLELVEGFLRRFGLLAEDRNGTVQAFLLLITQGDDCN